jgi:hypothetical protein
VNDGIDQPGWGGEPPLAVRAARSHCFHDERLPGIPSGHNRMQKSDCASPGIIAG